MATRNEAAHVVLSPQRDLRGLFRAIVAVVAALVIGMGVGRVIDDDRAAGDGNQAAVGVNAPPEISQFVGGAPALTGLVQIDGAVGTDAAKWAASARLFGLDNYLGDAAQQASAARLTALAEVYESRPGGDIWERSDFTPPYDVPSAPPAETPTPEPNGPHGMQ